MTTQDRKAAQTAVECILTAVRAVADALEEADSPTAVEVTIARLYAQHPDAEMPANLTRFRRAVQTICQCLLP